tara:strand:- start:825 stop:1307 length:483 start_codon:yes stop_codon:yes gene_type:complete
MSDQTPPPNPAARPERESLAGITFRPAHDSDAGALVALWEACGLTRPWNDPRKDIGFARDGAASDVLVGVEGDVIIASVMVGHDGHRGAVYYVAVDPSRQGTRLGRAVMAAAEDWLKARGVWKLNLMVRETNLAALGFYEGLGFQRSDVVVMQKVLTAED